MKFKSVDPIRYNILPACTLDISWYNHLLVFIVDTGSEIFVWIGSGSSRDEKKNALIYAHVS